MKLSQELNNALNKQIIHELRNQNIYSQIASYFEDLQLKNLANYFRSQSDHEHDHSKKFIQHINDRTGGKVVIGDVMMPTISITSIEDIGNLYIQTEEETTATIENLYNIALEEKSFIDLPFLLSMLDEQREEEDSAQSFAIKAKMVNNLVLFDATFEVGG